jgi:hypothetical protein
MKQKKKIAENLRNSHRKKAPGYPEARIVCVCDG